MSFVVFFLGILVLLHPVLGFLKGLLDLILVLGLDLLGELFFIFDCVSHCVDVVLKRVLGINLFLECLVLIGELLGIPNHVFNFFFAQATLVVSDSNALTLACSLFVGSN